MLIAQAAKAAVSSTVSELVDVLPKLASCKEAAALFETGSRTAVSNAGERNRATSMTATVQLPADVEAKNGLQIGATQALMKEARRAVIAARSVLF